MRSLDDILSTAFAVMIPQSITEPDIPEAPSICALKAAAVKQLIDQKKITCQFDIDKFNDINTVEQLEFYLMQYELTDTELLNIYRTAFGSHGEF